MVQATIVSMNPHLPSSHTWGQDCYEQKEQQHHHQAAVTPSLNRDPALEVSPPNLFNGNSGAQRIAIRAKSRRSERDQTRTSRKNFISDSIDTLTQGVQDFHIQNITCHRKRASASSLDDAPSEPLPSSSLPRRWHSATTLPQLGAQYRESESQREMEKIHDGEILPSDLAFGDMILDQGESLPEGTTFMDFVSVESTTDKKIDGRRKKVLTTVHSQILYYNAEPVWQFVTESHCDGLGTWGHSSTCVLNKAQDKVKIRITHKGRRNLGDGFNTREVREFTITDLIRQSGEARQKALMGQ